MEHHYSAAIKSLASEKFLSPLITKIVTIFVLRGDKNFSGATGFIFLRGRYHQGVEVTLVKPCDYSRKQWMGE